MKGFMGVFVLRELEQTERSGYDLMSAYAHSFGPRPSPGTMYPLLADLEKKHLVTVSKIGKRKIYHLTQEGKKFLASLMKEKQRSLGRIFSLMGMDKQEIEQTFGKFHDDMHAKFRHAIIGFLTSKRYEQNKDEYHKILSRTMQQIKRLT